MAINFSSGLIHHDFKGGRICEENNMCAKALARGLDKTGQKSVSSHTVCVTYYDIKDYEEKRLDKK